MQRCNILSGGYIPHSKVRFDPLAEGGIFMNPKHPAKLDFKSQFNNHRIKKHLPLLLLMFIVLFVVIITILYLPRRKLNKALSLLDAGEFDVAYKLLRELDKEDTIVQNKKERAVTFLKMGMEESAYNVLSDLTDQDSINMRIDIKKQVLERELKNATGGSYFSFGNYEQDNKTENGPEPIEWVILDREEDRILVISRYVLDCLHYDEEYKPVTWETCTLRAWLNGEFLNTAFDLDEMSLIQITHVAADPNPEFSVDPGNDTEDRIFLLSIPEAERYFHPVSVPAPHGGSIEEAERYFHTYSTLWCKPTAFAAPKSNVDFTQNEAVGWWLRTPGLSSASAAMADRLGKIDTWGKLVNCEGGKKTPGVRPAMWIDLGSSCEEVIP
jgi:hypothetical protein